MQIKEEWHKYKGCNTYRALKSIKLKEIFLVRYADDFKMLCKDCKTAQRVFVASSFVTSVTNTLSGNNC